MFTHAGPVRAVALEFHLAGERKQAILTVRNGFHDTMIELSAQQIDQ